jgi:hypothetical protein
VNILLIRGIVLLLSVAAAFGQTKTFYVPQYAEGAAGSVKISTSVTLISLETGVLNPARADIESFDESGTPANLLLQKTITGDQAVSFVQTEVQGRGTATVLSATETPDQATAGWVQITTEDSLAVEVIFSIFDATTDDLITTTSVLPRDPVTDGTLVVSVDSAKSLTSAVALLNPPTNDSADIAFTVYDEFGNEVGTGSITGLQPGEKVSKNWPELIPELQGRNDFVGSAEFTSTMPLAVLGLRQESIQLTTQDILSAR